jgi:hypothetical protein
VDGDRAALRWGFSDRDTVRRVHSAGYPFVNAQMVLDILILTVVLRSAAGSRIR